MKEKIEFSDLINSISYWLCFQEKIGRKFMIQESSLKYPIADYLANKHFPVKNIFLEYNHPYLKRRLIDVVLKDRDKYTAIFELKIASYNTSLLAEKKRIFNDLMRLYLLRDRCKETFFIISGSYEDFTAYFRNPPMNRGLVVNSEINDSIKPPDGFYTKWFSFFKNGETVIKVKGEKDEVYSDIYKSFLADYEIKENSTVKKELPRQIKTTCIAISPLTKDFPLPYLTAIWKVS